MNLSQALRDHSQTVAQTTDLFFQKQRGIAHDIHPSLEQSVALLQEFSLSGGKHIRSFLTLLAFGMTKKRAPKYLYRALASIELHHKHILILDDIADRDEKRYGNPTLEYSYRKLLPKSPARDHTAASFAMLDAVFLGALSKELLLESQLDPKTINACLHIFNTTMFRDTLAGWQIHGLGCLQSLAKSSEAEFIKGLELVTAKYTFTGPLLLGLTIGGNTDHTLQRALEDYALAVGTAFQIHDDILGLFGETKKTGKPVGNDVREGKKTLLLSRAYAQAGTQEKKILLESCGSAIRTDTLHLIQKIVRETGSLAYSQARASQYVQKGIQALDGLRDCPQKELLCALAAYCIARDK